MTHYMKPIDMAFWPRAELFRSYLNTDFPYIILGARVDVGPLLERCREEHSSFYFSLVYLAVKAADAIENFHYRFRDAQAYRIKQNIPVLTHMRPGEDVFIMLEGNPALDRASFCEALRSSAEQATLGQRLDCGDRMDLISFSCVPWIDYSHVIRTISHLGVDCNPKITWGKYTRENGKTTLNLSVQVHHGLMDGQHVGRFYEALQDYIRESGSGKI